MHRHSAARTGNGHILTGPWNPNVAATPRGGNIPAGTGHCDIAACPRHTDSATSTRDSLCCTFGACARISAGATRLTHSGTDPPDCVCIAYPAVGRRIANSGRCGGVADTRCCCGIALAARCIWGALAPCRRGIANPSCGIWIANPPGPIRITHSVSFRRLANTRCCIGLTLTAGPIRVALFVRLARRTLPARCIRLTDTALCIWVAAANNRIGFTFIDDLVRCAAGLRLIRVADLAHTVCNTFSGAQRTHAVIAVCDFSLAVIVPVAVAVDAAKGAPLQCGQILAIARAKYSNSTK
ncbi:hypothetical protein [Kordiimonas aquimaris]|nr:hypothetical protein [Kordiimonas aquimaris]